MLRMNMPATLEGGTLMSEDELFLRAAGSCKKELRVKLLIPRQDLLYRTMQCDRPISHGSGWKDGQRCLGMTKKNSHICPDFVIEVRSKSDSVNISKTKCGSI